MHLAASRDQFEELVLHGVERHRAGDLVAAATCYREALAIDPAHADAWHLLGLAEHQSGKHSAALDHLRRAIALDCRQADYHASLGRALFASGQVDAAVRALERAVYMRSGDARLQADLGAALVAAGRLDDARRVLETALRLDPALASAHGHFGEMLVRLGDAEEARARLLRAVDLDPTFVDALLALGRLSREQGDLVDAAECHERAAAIAPGRALVHRELACTRQAQGLFAQADAELAAALELGDEPALVHSLRALVRRAAGDWNEAAASLSCAIVDQPVSAEASDARARALLCFGLHEEALPDLDRAVAGPPALADAARVARAHALLALGRYAEAWPDLVAAQAHTRGRRRPHPRLHAAQPWQGEPLAGRTLLIDGTGPLSDVLLFLRYVPLAAKLGGRLIVQVDQDLVGLGRGACPRVEWVGAGDYLPRIDLRCALPVLPQVFGTTPRTVPAPVPYLCAGSAAAAGPTNGDMRRVGIVRPAPGGGTDPAVADALAQLVQQPGIDWHALPFLHDDDQGALATLAPELSSLDLIVTGEGAIAHLAGALGRPVWVLLGLGAAWCWQCDPERTPWYPTARLFRQPRAGAWAPVVDACAQALFSLAQARAEAGRAGAGCRSGPDAHGLP